MKTIVSASELRELVDAKQRADDLQSAYGDAIKAIAEKHGIEPSVLKKAVAATLAGKTESAKAAAEDLIGILDEALVA